MGEATGVVEADCGGLTRSCCLIADALLFERGIISRAGDLVGLVFLDPFLDDSAEEVLLAGSGAISVNPKSRGRPRPRD